MSVTGPYLAGGWEKDGWRIYVKLSNLGYFVHLH